MAKFETDFTMAVIFLFFVFWSQGGWYRVDCALGTQSACDLVTAEYAKEAKP
tara:strand:- start:10241 stop:10396 length:156 start_codon:yes stop_codon:yes gene_type:complete